MSAAQAPKELRAKVRVAMVYGGMSSEHEVSLATARAVLNAWDFDRYEVYPIYIDPTGYWARGSQIHQPLGAHSTLRFDRTTAQNGITWLMEQGACDLVFPLLHGANGEDGTVQGLLELLRIPYVGCGVLASAVGLDKVVMKQLCQAHGLPQCRFVHFTRTQWERDGEACIRQIENAIGYPCFVKPAQAGSSVGISKVCEGAHLHAAIVEAFRHDEKVLIEEAMVCREIEVGVLGNEHVRTSVVGEIVCAHEFYDYEAKYVSSTTQMVIPARLPETVVEDVQRLAVQAFALIGGTGLSRVDFFYREEDQAVFLNEINTMPGFTPLSMYPQLWLHTQMTYRTLLDTLIALAFERYETRQQHIAQNQGVS